MRDGILNQVNLLYTNYSYYLGKLNTYHLIPPFKLNSEK
ncbi:unnamed protein product, partial [Gulo gulo]